MSVLENLIAAVGGFDHISDETKAKLDAAMSQHASDVSDANQKLWNTFIAELGLFRGSAGDVKTAAEKFQEYAAMIDADHQRMRGLASEFAQKIDPPPDAPAGDMKVEFQPNDQQ